MSSDLVQDKHSGKQSGKQSGAAPEICTYLRGKNGLGRLEGGENPWQHIDKVTTTFTCLCTGEPFGPDYELADASRCSRERSCCIIAPA